MKTEIEEAIKALASQVKTASAYEAAALAQAALSLAHILQLTKEAR